jgi:hypothetical protein
MTPQDLCSTESLLMALKAPRNLNAPTRWKFSHFRNISVPVSMFNVREVMMGVTLAYPANLAFAALMSSNIHLPLCNSGQIDF